MGEISNKTIVALLVVALVVTVVGTVVSVSKLSGIGGKYSMLTGAYTESTGTTTVNVYGVVSLSVVDGTVQFDTGYYNTSCTTNYGILYSNQTGTGDWSCWLNSSGDTHDMTLAANQPAHHLQNNGTVNINLSVDTDQGHAESFLCENDDCTSNTASVEIGAEEADGGSACLTTLLSSWTTLLDATSETTNDICTQLNFEDTNNEVNVTFRLTVPDDTGTGGSKTLTLTYTAVENTGAD